MLSFAKPFVVVHDCRTSRNPLAFTVIVPDVAGTVSNANAPDVSVKAVAEKVPAVSSTFAPGTEAPLASRTTPATRLPSAIASGGAMMAARTKSDVRRIFTAKGTSSFRPKRFSRRLGSERLSDWDPGREGFIAGHYIVVSVQTGSGQSPSGPPGFRPVVFRQRIGSVSGDILTLENNESCPRSLPCVILYRLRRMCRRTQSQYGSNTGGTTMEWTTPQHEEICLSCEVSSYANAEL